MNWDELKTIPNMLTLSRLILFPFLWAVGFLHLRFIFGLIYLYGGITDVLDGIIARKLNQTSVLGAKLDSYADILMGSSLVFLLFFIPEFIKQHAVMIIVTLAVMAISYIIGLIKFREVVYYHLYTQKAIGYLTYIFFSHAILFEPNTILFYILFGIIIIGSAEVILIILLEKEMNSDIKSVFKRNLK